MKRADVPILIKLLKKHDVLVHLAEFDRNSVYFGKNDEDKTCVFLILNFHKKGEPFGYKTQVRKNGIWAFPLLISEGL